MKLYVHRTFRDVQISLLDPNPKPNRMTAIAHFRCNFRRFLPFFRHLHAVYFNKLLLHHCSDCYQTWSACSKGLNDEKSLKGLPKVQGCGQGGTMNTNAFQHSPLNCKRYNFSVQHTHTHSVTLTLSQSHTLSLTTQSHNSLSQLSLTNSNTLTRSHSHTLYTFSHTHTLTQSYTIHILTLSASKISSTHTCIHTCTYI